jgi:hypothetical protein
VLFLIGLQVPKGGLIIDILGCEKVRRKNATVLLLSAYWLGEDLRTEAGITAENVGTYSPPSVWGKSGARSLRELTCSFYVNNPACESAGGAGVFRPRQGALPVGS